MNVEFKFGIKQHVTMTESSVKGMVVALWLDLDGIKFTQVRYVDGNNAIKYHWARQDELAAV